MNVGNVWFVRADAPDGIFDVPKRRRNIANARREQYEFANSHAPRWKIERQRKMGRCGVGRLR